VSIQGISVLIAHGNETTRDELANILATAEGIQVVGVARDSTSALALARKLTPLIVLLDYDLPGPGAQGQGIETAEAISATLPATGVILVGTKTSAEVLRRAIVAGARQFLELPATPAVLLRTIRQVHDAIARYSTIARRSDTVPASRRRKGQTMAVFSPKGGVGCTTLATNLAIEIRQETGLSVVLVDAALPFGAVDVFLDVSPTRSLADLQGPVDQINAEFVENMLLTHEQSGVRLLLAPQRPELADLVTAEMLRRTLAALRERHEYVLVDTSAALDDRMLAVLEDADKILLMVPLNLAALKSVKLLLEVARLLQIPSDKLVLVATFADSSGELTIDEIEDALAHPVALCVPADSNLTARAVNTGTPVVLSGRGTPLGQAITDLTRRLVVECYPEAVTESLLAQAGRSRRLFKFFARG
jgi:pilus assembly protein CpaE